MKKVLLAIVGIISAGVLGASISEPIKKKPIAFNTASIETEQTIQKGALQEYVQVTRDGRQLIKDQQVQTDLVNQLPTDSEIHVYDGPKGKGYEIIIYNSTSTEHIGFGPEAASRTYIIEKTISTSTATST